MITAAEMPFWLSHQSIRHSKLFTFILFQFSFCPQGFLSQLRLTLCSDRSLMYSSWFEIKYLQQQQQCLVLESQRSQCCAPKLICIGCMGSPPTNPHAAWAGRACMRRINNTSVWTRGFCWAQSLRAQPSMSTSTRWIVIATHTFFIYLAWFNH